MAVVVIFYFVLCPTSVSLLYQLLSTVHFTMKKSELIWKWMINFRSQIRDKINQMLSNLIWRRVWTVSETGIQMNKEPPILIGCIGYAKTGDDVHFHRLPWRNVTFVSCATANQFSEDGLRTYANRLLVMWSKVAWLNSDRIYGELRDRYEMDAVSWLPV